MTTQIKICIVVSDPITVRAFLSDQIQVLSKHYKVTVVMNGAVDEEWIDTFQGVTFKHISILRQVKIIADLRALWSLYVYFCRQKFDIVHSVTPKAGLLGMLAACLAVVPHRFHTFTGQVWATRQGISRLFFKSLDRILAMLTNQILIDSASQRDFLISESVLKQGQGNILGHGSISGVDIEKFRTSPDIRRSVRSDLGIPVGDRVFLYLGRLNRDKGILDLAEAYRLFRESGYDGHLLLVGPDEADLEPLVKSVTGQFQKQIHFVGMTRKPQNYMAAADIFCLPSYREGFGSVIIEAASCGIPAIGSCIYGIVDAIIAEETGLLHEPRNPQALCQCMKRLALDEKMRNTMGRKAQERARTQFAKEILSQALYNFYQKILTQSSVDLCK
jgi:glycosyltransferase involved in cell wall biosynthesis